MIKSTFDLEKKLLEEGYEMVIGVDEAGKGPLAGPVVACAASYRFPTTPPPSFSKEGWPEAGVVSKNNFDLIRDSKTLSHKQREMLFDFIHEHFYVGVGICDHKTIDRMNILQASFLAMKSALTNLKLKNKEWIPDPFKGGQASRDDNFKKTIVLIDGNGLIPNFSLEQKAIVRGDKLVKSISAASIIAKVTRDRIMLAMHEKYPEYRFDKHKGYGTALHMAKLSECGPCEIHRQSFAPVKLAKKAKK